MLKNFELNIKKKKLNKSFVSQQAINKNFK